MRDKTRKAFTLTEVLIGLLITSILGGAAVSALWFFVNTFFQMDDYTMIDMDMERVVQRLAPDFAHIGLGMPNNRNDEGSFAWSFSNPAGADPYADRPIMAHFGNIGGVHTRWGGPVTVSAASTGHPAVPRANPASSGISIGPHACAGCHLDGYYIGPELYYAWAVPTGVMAAFEADPESMTLELIPNYEKENLARRLQSSSLEGRRPFGIPSYPPSGDTPRAWLLLPTLRIPMLADKGWNGRDDLQVTVASGPGNHLINNLPTGSVKRLDEIHLIRAARLYSSDGELTRTVFDPYEGNYEEVMTRNVVGLQFAYNPATRLLKMFLAVRGNERMSCERPTPSNWPDCLPPIDALRYRLLVKNTTWIIRN